ncbi:MAG: restriction endonuclease subunit S [Verrucomicrobia bacterium]|nr:restriction endonuclease subunit S [Verrucomicrobiota bacterium]
MKYMELGKFGFSFVKGINPVKSKEGEALLIPSGAIFPAGVNYSKTHKIIPDPLDKNKVLKESDILFNTGGEGTIGRCSLFKLQNTECYADGFVVRLRDEKRIAIPDYVFHALCYNDTLNQINNLKDGTTGITSIKVSNIKKLVLPFFEIAEQQTIASILSKTDEAIAETEILIVKYNRIKTGLMQDLLTKGIDENGNIRSEETHEFKDSPLGRIPKEWDVAKLGELITAIDPQPDHRTPPSVSDGIPYLGISDFLESGEIDAKNCRRVSDHVFEKQSKAFTIESGDLIFGKIGTIGKPKILPDVKGAKYALSANVILIKPNECPSFIYWTLISKYITDQVNLAIHSTSQPAFGMEKIRSLDIITPKPDERIRISEKLVKLESLLNAQKINLRKLNSLKVGLMQDLLSGNVRVSNITPNQSAS